MRPLPWSGRTWRYLPSGGQPLNFGYILEARGRWNREEAYGCLYLATTPEGARAEYERYRGAAAMSGLPFGTNLIVYPEVRPADCRLREGPDRHPLP